MMASAILDVAYNNLNALLLGKLYSKADLAYVNKGNSLPALANDSINGPLGRVAFPVFSRLQNDDNALRDAVRRSIRFSTFFVFPAMVGLAIVSPTLIPVLFGHQWLASIKYVQMACFTFALYPFHTLNLQCIVAKGRSGTILLLEALKKLIGLACLLLFCRQGVFLWMLMTAVVASPLMLIVNAFPARRLIGYSLLSQVKDVLPVMVLSGVMAAAVWPLNTLPIHGILRLVAQVIVGVTVYFVGARIFKMAALRELVLLVRPAMDTKAPACVRTLFHRVVGGVM